MKRFYYSTHLLIINVRFRRYREQTLTWDLIVKDDI